jgi:hypothetical protein
MNYSNNVLSFALTVLILHGPNGKPVYVEAEHIVSVVDASAVHPRAKAVINTQDGPLYVRETPEQIAKMLGVQQ